jgi:hypothetical protein
MEARHSLRLSNPLCRQLLEMEPDKLSRAKGYIVDRAIDDAAFILERIDTRWPTKTQGDSASTDF